MRYQWLRLFRKPLNSSLCGRVQGLPRAIH
jgi:hypothetical protein